MAFGWEGIDRALNMWVAKRVKEKLMSLVLLSVVILFCLTDRYTHMHIEINQIHIFKKN